MKHLGYISPIMNSYMVSLKYDFEELQSNHWLYTSTFADISADIPLMTIGDSKLQLLMIKLLGVVKWIIRESKNLENKYPKTKDIVNNLITHKDACLYLNSMYCNNTLNLRDCVRTFKRHILNNTWSFYILHLLMDVYDTHSFLENTMHYMHKQDLDFLKHNVYKLFLNITIQHIRLRFNNGLSLSFMEFEHDIDNIFDEINAYIPQFTIRSDTPFSREN